MPTSVTVSYGRKRTDKLGDGSFDAVELGSILTAEIGDDDNPLAIQESIYKALSKEIDQQFNSIPKHELAVLKAIPQQPNVDPGPLTSRQPEPDAVPAKPLAWLEDTVKKNTDEIQSRMQAMPGESIHGGGSTIDEYGTPPVSAIVPNEAVMYAGCRVFESRTDFASNGNEFGVLRVGKRGRDGIPGQYTNCRTFDGGLINQIKKIREGDMVDVYGFFKPWKNNADKFDLELQKVEMSTE